jgi:pyruvate dehydrogenase E2 component (dihydrolipoamide acetyltransferase)
MAPVQVGDGSKAIPVGTSIAILAEEGDDVSSSAIEALLAESEEGGSDAAPEAAAPPPPPPAAEPKKAEAAAPTPAPVAPSPPAASTLQPSSDRPYVLASPIAKRLALEQGIPLSSVVGTGPGGRVIKADIEAYKAPVAAPAVAAPTPAAPAASTPAPAAASSSKAAAPSTAAYTDTPVSNMRRVIASRLTESKTGAPHYYLTVEVNMDRVLKLRELFNSAAKSAESAGGLKEGVKGGVKLSVNDFIVKASSMALQDVPEANSGWHGDFVRQ